jgi:hypothetical protein
MEVQVLKQINIQKMNKEIKFSVVICSLYEIKKKEHV